MKNLITCIAWCLVALNAHARADMHVNCPQGLRWSSEGYCMLEFDRIKDLKCPAGSHLDQPSVTSLKICRAQGTCAEGAKPNDRGVCKKT